MDRPRGSSRSCKTQKSKKTRTIIKNKLKRVQHTSKKKKESTFLYTMSIQSFNTDILKTKTKSNSATISICLLGYGLNMRYTTNIPNITVIKKKSCKSENTGLIQSLSVGSHVNLIVNLYFVFLCVIFLCCSLQTIQHFFLYLLIKIQRKKKVL